MSANNFDPQIAYLEKLLSELQLAQQIDIKLQILNKQNPVQEYLKGHSSFDISKLTVEEEFVFKSILAINQGGHVFKGINTDTFVSKELRAFLETLIEIEEFYSTIGGVIGYHLNVLKLISKKMTSPAARNEHIQYHHPEGFHIIHDTPEVRKSIRWGIEAMQKTALLYPVGGAGDRLKLQDEKTNEALPAAVLPFCGKSLLEGLVRDLQAREYLYYKIYGRQLETPICMMTSHEKNNHHYILSICEENNWFGRSKESFHLFIQPLVPMITEEGFWVMQGPLKMLLKPGGHGVIWKLASDQGVLDKLMSQNYTKLLVRQINNPIAGTDHSLCSFVGLGYHYDKDFGFASCQRLLNTSEGMDVLVEKEIPDGFEYFISNIEYTEFEKFGIADVSSSPGSSYSLYPANTNILFADLETIKETVSYCPLPGMLVNMKTVVTVKDDEGHEKSTHAGRLESTMQNVSDYIVDHYSEKQKNINPQELKSYITYNERRKTISVAKKSYVAGGACLETPESCFYELLQNHEELLRKHCQFTLPESIDVTRYLEEGPSVIILFHPALGPLYQVIEQKIRKGVLCKGAELQLEIAECFIENLHLDGTLLVTAQDVFGSNSQGKMVTFNHQNEKCILKNVTVKNAGIDRSAQNTYWKNQIKRKEALQITLEGNAEFFAEDVVFEGNFSINVPSGHRMTAFMQDGKVFTKLEKISQPSWYWSYTFDVDDRIQLKITP